MERKQFTFYRSFYENIEALQTNKEKLQAYQLICGYALSGTEPDLTDKKPCSAAVFRAVRPVLDTARRRAAKYANISESETLPANNLPY